MIDRDRIRRALKSDPYKSLFRLAASQKKVVVTAETTVIETNQDVQIGAPAPTLIDLSPNARRLAFDVVTTPFCTYKQRGLQLKMSMRLLRPAREELIEKKMVKAITVGKSLYLAATEKLYEYLDLISPYIRNVSLEHSFLGLLLQSILETDPSIQRTEIEAPIGTTGRTGDLVAYLKNGDRWICETTLSSSNVTQLAARLCGKGYSRVIFVCRDDSLRKSVLTLLGNADFDPHFYATVEVTIFSALIKAKKKHYIGDNIMNLSLKKIFIAFLVILVMSRTGEIIQRFSEIDTDTESFFTFEPLADTCVEMRFLITIALIVLAFVVTWTLITRDK